MISNKGVTVKILAKEYQIACPEEEKHNLIEAAMLLDSRMKEIRVNGRVIGLERIAVMVALNLAHDLLKMDRRLLEMHNKIEGALITRDQVPLDEYQ